MNADTLTIRTEFAADRDAISRLHYAAFGSHAEADLFDALRRDRATVLSLVAEEDGRIIGHALYSRVEIETGARVMPALALAPLAVEPARQRRGVGSRLVREAHRRLATAGESIVFVVGDPDYYKRFGFSVAAARAFATPYDGAHVMALSLNPGAPKRGIVRYPPAFVEFG